MPLFRQLSFGVLNQLAYSETCIKRTPPIKRTVAEVPYLFPLFTLNETFIKRTQTPKKYLK